MSENGREFFMLQRVVHPTNILKADMIPGGRDAMGLPSMPLIDRRVVPAAQNTTMLRRVGDYSNHSTLRHSIPALSIAPSSLNHSSPAGFVLRSGPPGCLLLNPRFSNACFRRLRRFSIWLNMGRSGSGVAVWGLRRLRAGNRVSLCGRRMS